MTITIEMDQLDQLVGRGRRLSGSVRARLAAGRLELDVVGDLGHAVDLEFRQHRAGG